LSKIDSNLEEQIQRVYYDFKNQKDGGGCVDFYRERGLVFA